MTWYTVYLRDTDEIIASGTGAQCARAMGLTLKGFYNAVSRSATGTRHKYLFYKEHPPREEIPQ